MYKSIADYKRILAKLCCPKCNRPFDPDTFKAWASPNGWKVQGFRLRQWLSIECKPCNYDHSLWKLGFGGLADPDYNKSARRLPVITLGQTAEMERAGAA